MSPELVSKVTDAVHACSKRNRLEIREWQSRPLEDVYAVVYFDAIRVRRPVPSEQVRDEGLVRNKAVYLGIGVTCAGRSETGETLAIDPLDYGKCLANAKDHGWEITQVLNARARRPHRRQRPDDRGDRGQAALEQTCPKPEDREYGPGVAFEVAIPALNRAKKKDADDRKRRLFHIHIGYRTMAPWT